MLIDEFTIALQPSPLLFVSCHLNARLSLQPIVKAHQSARRVRGLARDNQTEMIVQMGKRSMDKPWNLLMVDGQLGRYS
jgi:hypothetical protein